MNDQALAISAGAALMNVVTYRKKPLDFVFDIDWVDLTGTTLDASIYLSRGSTTALTTAQVTFTVLTQTYQQWIDQCFIIESEIPCDKVATDNLTISTVTLAREQSVINALPLAQVFSEPTKLHWKLCEISPDPRVVVEGDFIILE